MEIRHANTGDIPAIMETYAIARAFMRSTGNTAQWTDGHPSEETVTEGIRDGKQYVCVCGGEIAGTFWFGIGNDPAYAKIYGGEWLNDAPYGVIHRLASNGQFKGVGNLCFGWCFDRIGNIRVDTHRDNLAMQNILKKCGYVRCGIIHLLNGAERLAFQKCR